MFDFLASWRSWFVVALAAANIGAAPASRQPAVDTETLGRLLEREQYQPSPFFKALIIVITGDEQEGFVYHPYSFGATHTDRDNWWPASSIKIFPAVAMLEYLKQLGFDADVQIEFRYQDRAHARVSGARLIRAAITQSSNVAFDRLVEVVGSRQLNDRFLTPLKGCGDTVLLRSYTRRVLNPDTGEGSLRHSPEIVVSSGRVHRTLEERMDAHDYRATGCRGIEKPDRRRADEIYEGNCTTLWDQAELMRRVMMHEYLRADERYDLTQKQLALLRSALAGRRARGTSVVQGLRTAFAGRRIETYHKPGYAMEWFNDVVFARAPDSGERFLVAMANFPGRQALDEAAAVVGRLLASRAFPAQQDPPKR
jgi:hypothetical protein